MRVGSILGRAVLGCALAAFAPAALIVACTRHADIRDEPDASVLEPPPLIDSGDLPLVDSGLDTDAYPTCEGRPVGMCEGPIDFPCDFEDWASDTADRCQMETGCKTNGWLEVEMNADGCVVAIRMDQPNDAILACLLAEFGAVRCPCGEGIHTHFFGLENASPCP